MRVPRKWKVELVKMDEDSHLLSATWQACINRLQSLHERGTVTPTWRVTEAKGSWVTCSKSHREQASKHDLNSDFKAHILTSPMWKQRGWEGKAATDASRGGKLRWDLTVGGPWWQRTLCSSGKENAPRMEMARGPTTALGMGAAQLKTCGAGKEGGFRLHLCFSSPAVLRNPRLSPVTRRGTDSTGRACDVHSSDKY